jgi:FtsP/CotA-like multicopper oxidase with cupredoxin domain
MALSLDRRRFLTSSLAGACIFADPRLPSAAAAAPKTLEAKPFQASLDVARKKIALSAFNASVPGPLLRVRQGDPLKLRLTNGLDAPLALHWHGVRLPNRMDGAPGLTQTAVAPGGTFDIAFPARDAGTFWYRPDVATFGAGQDWRGLHGMLIVEERTPPPVDHDIPMLLDDWRFDGGGGLADPGGDGESLLTINGKPAPLTIDASPGARLRLRLLNASPDRLLVLSLDGPPPLIVAVDGQPCDPFNPVRQTLPLSPGARFDVMVDLPRPETSATRLVLRGESGGDRDVLVVQTSGAARADRPAFVSLPQNPGLPAEIALQDAVRADIRIDRAERRGFAVNGQSGAELSPRPLFSARRGAPVSLGFVNASNALQIMHIHGHVCRILHDLDDGWDPYWRDSVALPPGKTHHVAFVADNPGKWLIESAILDPERLPMRTWFAVT